MTKFSELILCAQEVREVKKGYKETKEMYEYVEMLNGKNDFSKTTKVIVTILAISLVPRYHNLTNMGRTAMEWTHVGTVAATVDSSTGNSAMLHPNIEGGEYTISLKIENPVCEVANLEKKVHHNVHVNTKLVEMDGACIGGGYMVLTPNTYETTEFMFKEFRTKEVVNVVADNNWVGSFGTNGYNITEGRVLELDKFLSNTVRGKTLTSVWVK